MHVCKTKAENEYAKIYPYGISMGFCWIDKNISIERMIKIDFAAPSVCHHYIYLLFVYNIEQWAPIPHL